MKECKHGRYICLMIGMLVVVLVLGSMAVAEGELGVVMGGKLHLRAEASLEAKVLETVESGTRVQVLGTEGGWYRVQVPSGNEGYMEARYIGIASGGIVDNKGSFVNLRSAPSRDAKVIAEVQDGAYLTVLSQDGAGWSYVSVNGQEGYMAASFIKPAPEGMAESEGLSLVGNPYELSINGDKEVVQQVGRAESEISYGDMLAYTIFYPVLDIPAADEAIQTWITEILADAQELLEGVTEEAEIELTVQYDAYRVDGHYAGILETGYLGSNMFAHPSDLIFTLNVDLTAGTVLTYADIFTAGRTVDVLALVEEKLSALEGNPVEDVQLDETWLACTLLTPDSVAIVLPKGEYLASVWGTQAVYLPYETLAAAGLLALDISGTAEAGESAGEEMVYVGGERVIDPTKPMIALTFDDGPSDYTLKILGILEENGARATFCMVGNRIAGYKDVVAQVAAQGSEIATHTWSHKQLTTISSDEITSQLKRSMDAIEAITGQPVTILRPPYGAVNKEVKDACRRLGLTLVNWSIDTEDWKTKNAQKTYEAIMKHVKNGSIILCHDVKESTSVAMERVIPELVAQGYQLLTLTELLSFSETGGAAGVLYNHLDVSHLEGK